MAEAQAQAQVRGRLEYTKSDISSAHELTISNLLRLARIVVEFYAYHMVWFIGNLPPVVFVVLVAS